MRVIAFACATGLFVVSLLAWFLPSAHASIRIVAPDQPFFPTAPLQHRYAYATLLAAPLNPSANDDNDQYFVGARILVYSLLHNPETRTNRSIPVLVLVTEDVKQSKRERLTADGAIVIPIQSIRADWVQARRKRWRDCLAKLHLFRLIQYDRILFLDPDTLVVKRLDSIFEDPASAVQATRNKQTDDRVQPESYVFASVSGQGGKDHPWPPRKTQYPNAGFVLIQPSRDLFEVYMALVNEPGSFDPTLSEQNLWAQVHHRQGNMPWQQLEPTWNVNWATERDWKAGAASLHVKWWDPHLERDLAEFAMSLKGKMEGDSEARDILKSQGRGPE